MISARLRFVSTSVAAALLVAGTAVHAFQFGGMGPIPQTQPTAAPKDETAAARHKLAEQALADIDALEKKGQLRNATELRSIWHARWLEAGAARSDVEALKAAEAVAKQKFDKGETTAIPYYEAQFVRLKAEALHANQKDATQGGGAGGGFGPGGGGGFGGSADAGSEEPRNPPRKPHPGDVERNKAIEERLEKVVPMNFPHETALADVLKYVGEATKNAKGKAIPIYVDPQGLQAADKTPASAVTIDLDDLPLRTTLRLILEQLDLDYQVRDGMIFITDSGELELEAEFERRASLPRPAMGMGMGMGGMGMGTGGMGGGFR